jgi:hypothetical protein
MTWVKAIDVERPPGMEATEPSAPPVNPSGGGLGHPGHFVGQGHLLDVVRTDGGLVAVGFAYPDWLATSWTSADGARWTRHEIGAGPESFMLAAVADGRRVVAVGRVGNDAAAWVSDDAGITWERAPAIDALHEPPAAVMTSVSTKPDGGYVAGGWTGLFTQPVRALFWTSPDGLTWTRGAEDPGLDDARVLAIARGPSGLVAVGTTGIEGRPTGSAAWTSTDGHRWERVTDAPTLEAGLMLGLSTGGHGFVAVGSDLDAEQAAVWRSTDGRDWQAAGGQSSFDNYGLKISMADVTAAGPGLVAVGHFLFGTQFPEGAVWSSPDGVSWTRAPDVPALGQGRLQAVIGDGERVVAVGTVGAPDSYIPTVWLSPGVPGG